MVIEENLGFMGQYIDAIKTVKEYKDSTNENFLVKAFMSMKYKIRLKKLMKPLHFTNFILNKDEILELFDYIHKDVHFVDYTGYIKNIRYNNINKYFSVSLNCRDNLVADILVYKEDSSFTLTFTERLPNNSISTWSSILKEMVSKKQESKEVVELTNKILNKLRAEYLQYIYDSLLS